MTKMEAKDIKRYIPHRYPFLLVDRVLSYKVHESLRAIKNVTINEPFFQGHFPVKPVMPGVLMIEALAQAAGILTVRSLELPEDHTDIYYFAGVDKVRFKRVVEPGDQLQLDVEVMKVRSSSGLWKFLGIASVDGEVACTAEIMTIKGSEE